MINYPKILVMTTAEYEAQKNTIESTTLVRLTDNPNSPLAVGDQLLDGGSEPTFPQTFLTATDETSTLTNSVDVGSLGANGTKNLLSYEINTGVATFSDVLIPETSGLFFNNAGTPEFTDTFSIDKLDVTTTDPAGTSFTTDVFTVTAGTNILTVDETKIDLSTAALTVTTTDPAGIAFTTASHTVTAGTNVFTVNESEVDITSNKVTATTTDPDGIALTTAKFMITAGTNIFTVDETNFSLAGLASGTGTALVLDVSNNILLDSSSKRYKHDIKDLKIDSSRVYDLQPKSFKFNVTNMDSFGLIAEEVNEILPELVVKNKKNEIESVMYNRLPILLLCELKKLRDEVDELKKSR